MSKKTDLQDRALEKKLSITTTGDDDKERDLTIAELEKLLAASEAFPNQDETDPELNALQERALEQELSIYGEPDEDGSVVNLTADELRNSLAEHATEAKAAAADAQAEKDRVRQSAVDNPIAPVPTTKAAQRSGGAPILIDPKHGLPKPTAGDKALAKKHGYSLVIPGGRAYMSLGNINCAYGAGLRRKGQTIILTPEHAANKMDHLQAL